ncbi:MAG: sulfurtransferase-like selenium metabolism protein YedF [Campylobacteraceae bacterium]|nr:sulfurtransferase-like selenium metabolism protein YedF [Campylobacteraceae bacterium]
MQIDCCNLQCPQPVLETKKALESLPENGILSVSLNSIASYENVLRFAKSSGCEVREEKNGDITKITIIKGCECKIAEEKTGFSSKTIFLKEEKIGEGELGHMLMIGFLKNVLEQKELPKQVICVNKAVLLATSEEKSPSVEVLKSLVERGVKVYSCGICLEFYGVENDLKVGEIGNAYSAVEMLLESEGVISL